MPKAKKEEIAEVVSLDGYEGRFAELGGYTVGFESYSADADMSDLFKGLPDDRCQCPHWGVVVNGKLTYTDAAGEKMTIGAGEAYYAPPGHLPYLHAGTQVIEFSPTKELNETMVVIERNIEASG